MPRIKPQGGAEPMRALIYARYSSANQKEASIEDQVRICRERADREGWEVVDVFSDFEMSGKIWLRPGLQALLERVSRGDIDLVVAEALDRLARDEVDTPLIRRKVQYAGAEVFTLNQGMVTELHTALQGAMDAHELKKIADKTRRGQTGRVLAGFNPGGCAYGYRRVARFDERGEPVHGLREIDEDEAAVIRRIYAEFVDGRSPRAIAGRLNAEGTAGPSGGPWSAASINGDRVRKNGILQNELYRGMLVFNRTRRSYDPDSRKKRIRTRPAEEWTVRPAPELRIVSDDLWEAVSARRARFDGTRIEQQRRPKRLLSGLVRCGCCGGNYVVIGPEKWGCGNRRQRGTCGNGRTIQTHMLERRVLAGLQGILLDPELVRTYVLEYHRAAQERAGEEARERRRLEKRRGAAQLKVDRLLRAVTEGGSEFAEIRHALERARAELASVSAEISTAAASSVIALHPGVADDYRRNVAGLRELLDQGDEDARHAARQRLRALIESVVVTPAESGPGTAVTLEGRLAALLDLAAGRAVIAGDVCQRWCPGGDSNFDIHSLKRAKV